MMNNKTIHIFTDGACKGNPGVGGWGVVLRYGEHEKQLCGGAADTTNNQMELTAVIQGLEALKKGFSGSVIVYTDSQYVQKGMNEWIFNWKKNNWKTAAKHNFPHSTRSVFLVGSLYCAGIVSPRFV